MLGCNRKSVASTHSVYEVIKLTVRSGDESESTTEGLNLVPLRFVNGKLIKTKSPLAIIR